MKKLIRMISALLAVMLLLVSQSAICDEPEGKTVIDDEIELKFIHPEIGSTSKTEPSITILNDECYFSLTAEWADEYTFEAGCTYTCFITLTAYAGYAFDVWPSVRINGSSYSVSSLSEDYTKAEIDYVIILPGGTPINNVSITVIPPTAGTSNKTKLKASVPNNSHYYISGIYWNDGSDTWWDCDYEIPLHIYEAGEICYFSISIAHKDPFYFTEDTRVTLEGCKEEEIIIDAQRNTIDADISITIPEVCNITFDPNGGSGSMDAVSVTKGEKYTLPVCSFIAPKDKEFDTWDKGVPGTEILINDDIVVKALWKDNPASTPTPTPAPTVSPTPEPTPDSGPQELITLKKLKSVKLKAVSKKKIKVSWKKLSSKNRKKIRMIEIQVSIDPDFQNIVKTKLVSSKKTSYTVSGLKKNTKYYIRVRAYTEKDGIRYVSDWVEKSKKTKKK